MHSVHMQPVHFSEDDRGITARTRLPLPAGRFAPITIPLAKRGVDFTIDFETGEHIEARLPDGSFLFAGPTFDEIDEELDTAGPQNGWFVGWLDPRVGKVEVEPLYDSQFGGLDQQHGTDVAPMRAALDAHLDRRGVPTEQDVQDRRNRAESLLRRAGFVAVTTGHQQTHHRLPSAMTDPVKRRAAVTRAIDYLRAEGFAYDCPVDLVNQPAASADHTPHPDLAEPAVRAASLAAATDARLSAALATSPTAAPTRTGQQEQSPRAPAPPSAGRPGLRH
ncbi:hypothetical protein ACIQI7_22125 [Kitasatospora sp. NPDC092039]|uniref:hypothetical protein n=1 Tax=Kitasatospora sp. NPDC092039 TaxID=3364086 RepID=UPI00381C6F1B